jgi:hypothetical protein
MPHLSRPLFLALEQGAHYSAWEIFHSSTKMKTHFIALALLATSLVPALAADLPELAASPAAISVKNGKLVPLVVSTEKKGWAKIPPELAAFKPTIFAPNNGVQGNGAQGFTEFDVLADGYVLIACNFEKQGNPSGDWTKDAWSEDDFKNHGWLALDPSALTGSLTRGDDRQQIIFYKKVQKSETYHLRCNKYDPPFPLLLQPGPPQTTPPSPPPTPAPAPPPAQ